MPDNPRMRFAQPSQVMHSVQDIAVDGLLDVLFTT